MGALAGHLTAAREGLRPVGADVLEAAAARLTDDAGAVTPTGRNGGMVANLAPARRPTPGPVSMCVQPQNE